MRFIIIAIFIFAGISTAQSPVEKITPWLDALLSSANQTEELLIWVFFNDKGNDLQQYFDEPQSVVSEKSLKRRSKVLDAANLISETDLPVNANYIDAVKETGFKLKQKSRWFNGISGYATKSEILELSRLHFVKKLDVVQKYKNSYSVEENESGKSPEMNRDFQKPGEVQSYDYGQSFTQLNQIKIPAVHDLGYTGAGVTICMMDAGFDRWTTHQVFNSLNVIATWDFVNGDPDVENGSDMGDGSHGTSTLSAIGGFYEGELIGPAFGADFILAKTENTESETPIEEDNWIAALEWADSIGVDLTSTSLGYLDYDPPYQGYTWEDMNGNTALITIAGDNAVALGIVVVNSAGNGGYNTHNTLGAPADGDSIIAAGSVTSSGQRSSFSSVGPTTDPPGRIKPDLMAMGSDVYVARNWSNNSYGTGSGTSFSCPLLAGACSLLLEIDPSITPIELRELLKSTASQSSNPNNLMGWGIINTLAVAETLLTTTITDSEMPDNFYLLRNYPNPFNPSTKIQFSVPERTDVQITLHDILGRVVKELFNDQAETGLHEIELDGKQLSSGVYLVRMQTKAHQKTIKISLLK